MHKISLRDLADKQKRQTSQLAFFGFFPCLHVVFITCFTGMCWTLNTLNDVRTVIHIHK